MPLSDVQRGYDYFVSTASRGFYELVRAGLISPARIAQEFERSMREIGILTHDLVVTQSAYDPRRLDVRVQLMGMIPPYPDIQHAHVYFDQPEYPTLWDHLLAAE